MAAIPSTRNREGAGADRAAHRADAGPAGARQAGRAGARGDSGVPGDRCDIGREEGITSGTPF